MFKLSHYCYVFCTFKILIDRKITLRTFFVWGVTTYTVSRLIRYTQNLNKDHWTTIDRLARYLRGTIDYSLYMVDLH